MSDATIVKDKNQPGVGFSNAAAAEISQELIEWFGRSQRELNFRKTQDPYAIMVSEFMLQQTTVAVVEPYFERFMERFPTVQSLAAASEDEVMGYWAGLGYYRRARQLRAAALELVSRWGAQYPTTVKEMQTLPGFGRYTAGAVLSFAFNLRVPILEANTVRVYARLAGQTGIVGDVGFTRNLWSIAESLVSVAESPRLCNLGAMELGALICRPKPKCEVCPVKSHCIAYRSGQPDRIPQPRPRREKVEITTTCVAIRNADGRYLVRKIPQGEWHSGLWEFPSSRIAVSEPDVQHVRQYIRTKLDHDVDDIQPVTRLKYAVTHHSITCHVFHCHTNIEIRDIAVGNGDIMFSALEDIADLAMGSAQKKLLKLLMKRAAEGTRP